MNIETTTTKTIDLLRGALARLEAGEVEHVHEALPRSPSPAGVLAERLLEALSDDSPADFQAREVRRACDTIESLQVTLANIAPLCGAMSLDDALDVMRGALQPLARDRATGLAHCEVRDELERELAEVDGRAEPVRRLAQEQSAQVARAVGAALERAATWYGDAAPRLLRTQANCEAIHAALARDDRRVELACEGDRTVAWHPLAAALALLPALEPGTGDEEDRALAALLAMRLRPLLAECLGMHTGARAHRSAQAAWYGDGPRIATAEEACEEAYEAWGADLGAAALRERADAKALWLRYAAGYVTARSLIPQNGAER
jgi:hypothetical protein